MLLYPALMIATVKLFRSLEWEQKLIGFVNQFEDHKKELHFDLSMHASIGIDQANTTLLAVSGQVENTESNVSMVLLLQLLRSPKERQLIKKIELKGGAERVLKDENILKELIAESGEKEMTGDAKVLSKDKQAELVKEVVREASRTFEDMVKENEELFTRKFKAQEIALKEEMETVTKREGDRIIGVITGGPHERILDPVSSYCPSDSVLSLIRSGRTCTKYGENRLVVHICTFRRTSNASAGLERHNESQEPCYGSAGILRRTP